MTDPQANTGGFTPEAGIDAAMQRAIALSHTVLGRTSPNPPVGAVVLGTSGDVVGEGATQPPGGPHAEVVALILAGQAARGGTAVVTLEPCAHTGQTGPCSQALAEAGIAHVVYATPDPTARAAGGADRLRAAGVTVEHRPTGVPPLRAWLHLQRTGRPYVTWKYAATLDGRTAAADGTSRWITGPEARADVHRMRDESDAVLVGIGTVLADDPELTVRPSRDGRQPLRVVLDRQNRLPAAAKVLGPGSLVLSDELAVVLATLVQRGVVSLLLETGPTLAAAFLRAGLVDEVVGYLAPALLGSGPAAVSDLGVGTISEALRLQLVDVSRVGPDVRLTMRRG